MSSLDLWLAPLEDSSGMIVLDIYGSGTESMNRLVVIGRIFERSIFIGVAVANV